jgi:hypothetical protein
MTASESVLDLPIESGNDADASTVRGYLIELLATLWRQGAGFSSKRPFGESDWQYSIYTALLRAGLVTGQFDENGYVEDVDYAAADDLICRAIRDVLGHRPLPPAEQVIYEATEWCASEYQIHHGWHERRYRYSCHIDGYLGTSLSPVQ